MRAVQKSYFVVMHDEPNTVDKKGDPKRTKVSAQDKMAAISKLWNGSIASLVRLHYIAITQ